MTTALSESAAAIVCGILGVTNTNQLLDRDYRDISPETDVDRDKTRKYADRNRGSVRLNAGKFYTASEFADRVEAVSRTPLP